MGLVEQSIHPRPADGPAQPRDRRDRSGRKYVSQRLDGQHRSSVCICAELECLRGDYGSIRGRLGVTFDRFLVFGTAGLAWGNPSTAYALLGSAPFAINSVTSFGWTAGAGLEYAITDTALAQIEYRYTDLESSGFRNIATNTAAAANRLPISGFRAGLAYKFADGLIVADSGKR
jgi:opacity protein-like surface antigen